MPEIVFVASHVGYPMDRTPLGGGAAVGIQLAREWARLPGVSLTVVGSGPESPGPGIEYHRLPGEDVPLVRLSELGYARFCRRFEAAATELLRRRRARGRGGCVVVNDISESPDLAAVAAMGYPILSIWHVDVVDYFSRMYFRGAIAPETAARAYERLRPRLGWAVPDVLRLVFEKQREAVLRSERLVVPSRAMVETLDRCYPGAGVPARAMAVPWGGWGEPADPAAVKRRARELRARWAIGPEARVLMTLSRFSPEKGLHLLLGALERLEASSSAPESVVFLCGEAAFMQGAAYDRRLRRAAERLKRVKVRFPGYVAGLEKAAYFELAELFVSPSVHESYGLTLVEALRAGKPVLASDHYGVREIFADPAAAAPDTGFGVTVSYAGRRPEEALAAALSGLLADRARLAAMGERARAAGARMSFPEAARRVAEAASAAESAAPARSLQEAAA